MTTIGISTSGNTTALDALAPQQPSRCRLIVATLAAAAGLGLAVCAPAQAGDGTSALCTVTLPAVLIEPPFAPLSLTPSAGRVTSEGHTGTVRCNGEIRGRRVSGPGTAAIDYERWGTCAAHTGQGDVEWRIPTEAGLELLVGDLSVRRLAVGVLAAADFRDARADFAGALYPLEGDCVLTPLSRVGVIVTGSLLTSQ